ncbi:hypothetical protein RHMOL_Rhmol05G0278500 [Rhododendron molle]|uniref:Uncharacterized protein n=1 Tax=Rhododendron molle TaxID=49168 RepID=A0ACC0NV49_RHOML|nr:hypothetical protein RHMOL_Rhmol05G0278500 [Rhododendron molle]
MAAMFRWMSAKTVARFGVSAMTTTSVLTSFGDDGGDGEDEEVSSIMNGESFGCWWWGWQCGGGVSGGDAGGCLRWWTDPLWMLLRLSSVCPFRILAVILLLRRGDLMYVFDH